MEGSKGTVIGLAVLAVAGIGALLTTQGTPGVPPTSAGLAAAALFVLAGAAWLTRPDPARTATALLLLGLAAVGAQDAFRAGIAHGHDVPSHTWATYATWRAALDGDPFPRWTPYLGLGQPLMQFYGPIPWLMTWPAQALGAPPVEALRSGMVISAAVAAASTYAGCRWLGRSPAASLVGAAALVLGPYRLLDQTYRFAYAEAFAMALLPALLAAAVLVARGDRAVGRLALLGGLVVLTHPVTGLLLVPVSLVPLAVAWRTSPDRKASARAFAVAVALALGATAVWWVPMAVEQPHTTLDQTARIGRSMGARAAWPEELITRQAWERYDLRRRHRDDRAAQGAAVPMYFGWGLAGLVMLGFAASRRRSGGADSEAAAWAGAAAVGAALAVQPTAYALDLVPISGRVQFAWRFLSPATACAALAAASAVDGWAPAGRERSVLAAAALALLTFDAVPSLGAPGRLQSPDPFLVEAEPDRFVRVERIDLPPTDPALRAARSKGLFPEYDNAEVRAGYSRARISRTQSSALGVRWRKTRDLGEPAFATLDGAPLDVTFDPRGERIDVGLPKHAGGRLVATAQYFPGWRARVDGGAWFDPDSDDGLLALDLEPTAREVQFRYSTWRPWDRTAGRVLTLLTLIVVGIRRSRPAAPSEPQ
ncbi:MAG: hypothetical protein GY898_29080 [Proteobacteria bacterium]|nr:hypothetical protein [Pseudomonadota bacterium]